MYYERVPVIMEENEWAIVVKPPGLCMYSDAKSAFTGKASLRTLATILPYTLQASAAADALVVPAAVHRLDAPVGGLVVCAKTRSAARCLDLIFRAGGVRKTYVALLVGTPSPPEGMVDAPLDGKACLTAYKVLTSQRSVRFGTLAKVELRPISGRTHQLRRHCAEALECPILGDVAYGGSRVQAGQALYLWAARLEFQASSGREESLADRVVAEHATCGDLGDSGGEYQEYDWEHGGADGPSELKERAESIAAMVELPKEADAEQAEMLQHAEPRAQHVEKGEKLELIDKLLKLELTNFRGVFLSAVPEKFDKAMLRDQVAWAYHVLRTYVRRHIGACGSRKTA